MSSMNLISTGKGVRGAWETDGRILTTGLSDGSQHVQVSGENARHPGLAVNTRGETLVL